MKNLKKLAAECEAELRTIGIPCGTVRNWSVNTRAKKRWGQCKMVADGVFDIDISVSLLQDEIDDTAAKTTIIHELLHTVEGCQGHKGKWKELAGLVSERYPQYQIKRTSSCEEKGIPKEIILQKESGRQKSATSKQRQRGIPPKYRITCTGCGVRTYRQRASRLIQRPEEFRCGRCGGKLLVEVRVE